MRIGTRIEGRTSLDREPAARVLGAIVRMTVEDEEKSFIEAYLYRERAIGTVALRIVNEIGGEMVTDYVPRPNSVYHEYNYPRVIDNPRWYFRGESPVMSATIQGNGSFNLDALAKAIHSDKTVHGYNVQFEPVHKLDGSQAGSYPASVFYY